MGINVITGLVLTHLAVGVLGFVIGHYRGWLSEFKHNERKEAENELNTCGPRDPNIKKITIFDPKTGKTYTPETYKGGE